MRAILPVARLSLSCLLLSAPLAAQNPALRDPQALAVLQQAFTAVGGGALSTVTDIRAEYSVKEYRKASPIQYTTTLKILDRSTWRLEAEDARGMSHSVFRRSQMQTRWPTGELRSQPSISLAGAGIWLIPALTAVSDYQDPQVELEYEGLQAESRLLKVVLQQHPKDTSLAEVMKPIEVYVDPGTLLPVKMAFSIHPPENLLTDIPVEVGYRDYRNVSGLLVPSLVFYSVDGQLVREYKLVSFAVNVGLDEKEFKLR